MKILNRFTGEIICLVVMLGVLFGWCIYFEIKCNHEKWVAYERGARAIIEHHKYYGNYGSIVYREVAYEWGNPQNEKDLMEIETIVNERHRAWCDKEGILGAKRKMWGCE